MRVSVFLYGSLMIPESISKALGRTVTPDELRPVVLKGYKRVWRAQAPIFSTSMGKEISGVFLDLAEAPGGRVNGLLIDATDMELGQLRLREAQYDEMDITDFLVAAEDRKAITFVAKQSALRAAQGLESFIPRKYKERIHNACKAIGIDFFREFVETTERSRFPSFEGAYHFLDHEQQKRV